MEKIQILKWSQTYVTGRQLLILERRHTSDPLPSFDTFFSIPLFFSIIPLKIGMLHYTVASPAVRHS